LLDKEIDDALTQLRHEWNIAERRIKKAELVRANNVVSSATFELRYAGRKLIDALAILQKADWRLSPEEKQQVLQWLADATEDCVKAKHDAIDAMLVFVTTWMERTEASIGLAGLVEYFPTYIETTGKISNLQDRIADSRFDRAKGRESIYDGIERHEYEQILSLYSTMLSAESRVTAQVAAEKAAKLQEKRRTVNSLAATQMGTYGGIFGGIIGAAGISWVPAAESDPSPGIGRSINHHPLPGRFLNALE
jgi:hypothetical protein